MECSITKNDNHDDKCDLWFNRLFWDGEYKWDGAIGRLVIDFKLPTADVYTPVSANPWENAEDYVWDGDNPIISIATALDRMENAKEDALNGDDWLSPLEDEALAAYLASGADEFGWVQLPDGSWADQEGRVTYRITKDADGKDCWVEEKWDEPLEDPYCDCTPPKQYFCAEHNVTRNKPGDAWEWRQTYSTDYSYSKCSHCFDRFILPNADAHPNVDIRISGNRKHTEATTPDLGVYASNCWNPSAPAIFIPWTDYGLPEVSFTRAANALKAAWNAALAGQVVEFGCMGGHGRTGTMLACIAVLADPTMSGDEAVAHVRKVHCNKAVEVAQQEWYVRWFAAFVRDLPFSEVKPTSWAASYTNDDDWGYGTYTDTTTIKGTTALEDAVNDNTVEYTEVHADRTITKYKSGKLVVDYKAGGSVTTRVAPRQEPAADASRNTGPPGSACVWGEHCQVMNCNYYHPKAPSPAAGTWTPDGNVAPGATANARRQAEKRARRQEAAKRAKQKRNRQYVNSRTN